MVKRISSLFLLFCFTFWLSWSSAVAFEGKIVSFVPYYLDSSRTNLLWRPAWSEVTFATLPSFSASGMVKAEDLPDDLKNAAHRSWRRGDRVSSILTLADLVDLGVHRLTFSSISKSTSLSLSSITIAEIPLLRDLTIAQVLQSVLGLRDFKVSELPLFSQLLDLANVPLTEEDTLGSLLDQDPDLGFLKLDRIDLNLFDLESIPGLASTPFSRFPHWSSQRVDSIPELVNVPWSLFPNPPTASKKSISLVGFKQPVSEQMPEVVKSLSGSELDGFDVSCSSCRGLLVSGEGIGDRYWALGRQLVRGGFAELATVSDGFEPTGSFLYSSAFKAVLTDISKTDDTATFSLFFKLGGGEAYPDAFTPYVVGPIPLAKLPLRTSISSPDKKYLTSSKTELEVYGLEGLHLPSLVQAYKGFISFDSYQKVGDKLVDSSANKGYYLGRYSIWSRDPLVRELIASKSEGERFLRRLDNHNYISFSDVLEFFPPEDQDYFFLQRHLDLLRLARSKANLDNNKDFPNSLVLIEVVGRMVHYYQFGERSQDEISAEEHEVATKYVALIENQLEAEK